MHGGCTTSITMNNNRLLHNKLNTIGKIWLKDVIMHYVLENHYKSQGHNCMLSCLKAKGREKSE